jgi:hypothetical protein
MAEQEPRNIWPETGRVKTDLVALYGTSLFIAATVFLVCLIRGIGAFTPLPRGGAIDFAVLSFSGSIFLLSLGTNVINNFIFLGEKKDWRDFWSSDMLEYFVTPIITERWRAARGRFILSIGTGFSGFAAFYVYAFFRSLAA